MEFRAFVVFVAISISVFYFPLHFLKKFLYFWCWLSHRCFCCFLEPKANRRSSMSCCCCSSCCCSSSSLFGFFFWLLQKAASFWLIWGEVCFVLVVVPFPTTRDTQWQEKTTITFSYNHMKCKLSLRPRALQIFIHTRCNTTEHIFLGYCHTTEHNMFRLLSVVISHVVYSIYIQNCTCAF